MKPAAYWSHVSSGQAVAATSAAIASEGSRESVSTPTPKRKDVKERMVDLLLSGIPF
ncbi:MAG: hypothetical protein V4436_01955 [Patescibacteria group bacterium]